MKNNIAVFCLFVMSSTVFAANVALDCKVSVYAGQTKTIEMSGPCAKDLYSKLEKTAKSFESSLSSDSLTENNITCIRDHKNFASVDSTENLPSEDFICQLIQK